MVPILSFALAATALSITFVNAFPHYARDVDFRNLDAKINQVLQGVDLEQLHADARERLLTKRASTWSPTQRVDVTGVHAWAAPTKGQTRGPCPGLNVLSNHGYFARSGNTNLVESINALTSVFNMGIDTATALVVYSIAIIGDPIALTWSIGSSPGASTLLPGLLSPPGGISQSHNNYESDASVTRGDSFLTGGDVDSVQIEFFKQLYALQNDSATADYNQDVIMQHRRNTIRNSISKNPHFFYSAFPGFVVATAAHNFVPQFFSNYSAEYPEGRLNQEGLKSFFSITGDTIDTLKWIPGWERFPVGWSHGPTPYTLVDVVAGVLKVVSQVPEAGKIGGNTGTVNSFVGVDIANLTGGALNAATLLQGNNALCFGFAAARQGLPSVLGGALSLVGTTLNFVDNKLGGILPALGCPTINKWNLSVFNQFPGSG